jgi:hypothetical protein
MNQQAAAIVIAGVLIAAAIAFTNHWALVAQRLEAGDTILRLNRWTGSVVNCVGLINRKRDVWEVTCPPES